MVPPAEIVGEGRTEIGDEVVILEHSALIVGEAGVLQIGDRTRLARGVHILCTRSVEIGEAVSTSDHVAILDAWAPPSDPGLVARLPPPEGAPVVIERGAYLGYGCVIGPGVRVGAGAFVGEGAVVLDDVGPHTVVYGNPARPIRNYEDSTGAWVGSVLP